MISCKLQGGLGNYMFQIAAMYSLSDDVGFDLSRAQKVHKDIFKYTPNIFRKINTRVSGLKYEYCEPSFRYSPLPTNDNILFNGYFQSEKYLDRSKILNLFSIDPYNKKYIKDKFSEILNNAVSIHIRRGDYLIKQDRHPVQDKIYYDKAIEYFADYDKFLIFSDDMEWCKDNFIGNKFIFIEHQPDYIDLWLMSLCKHNIIANSSFSWWGAWLNTNPNKIVIAPKKWFGNKKNLETTDLIPKTWKSI